MEHRVGLEPTESEVAARRLVPLRHPVRSSKKQKSGLAGRFSTRLCTCRPRYGAPRLSSRDVQADQSSAFIVEQILTSNVHAQGRALSLIVTSLSPRATFSETGAFPAPMESRRPLISSSLVYGQIS